MDDLDPAAGAMHAMPVSGEQSFAPPCGGRGRGRPKGSRNKATLALEAVLEEAAEELTHKLVDTALAGDGAALRFCLGRLLPPLRDHPVMFDLPPIESAGDLVTASRAVLAACAEGILTPREATQVMDLIISARAIMETASRVAAWESRLQACEAEPSREPATPCEGRAPLQHSKKNHPAPAARTASSRHETLGVSGCEIDQGIAAPRRVGCKSLVFNSFATTPAGQRTVREILSVLGEGGGAAMTTASTRLIRGPPPHQNEGAISAASSRASCPGPISQLPLAVEICCTEPRLPEPPNLAARWVPGTKPGMTHVGVAPREDYFWQRWSCIVASTSSNRL